MIKAMVIVILAGLSFLQGSYVFGGMAFNPRQCTPHLCPTPTPWTSSRTFRRTFSLTSQPTPQQTPIETIAPTETPTLGPTEPPPTDTPTPEPTEEPWTCPSISDYTKKEYRDLCMASCKDAGLNGCGKVCKGCWESE